MNVTEVKRNSSVKWNCFKPKSIVKTFVSYKDTRGQT